ncbi:MAG: hypothetical protein HKN56_02795 [Gammaproteobacteria bacterium]|nr:hypothetical protein [Gammaproteobacteria bacterium]NND53881.1 hypothetical protein [Gammaproteobacteria bacterium]
MTDELLESERRIVTSREEVLATTVQIASRAERTLTILTPDLEPGLYDNEQFLDAIKRLVLAKSYSRVRALISNPARAVRTGNKFVALAARLNTCIDIRNLHEKYRGSINDAFIIADDKVILYRADGRANDGIMGTHEPEVARQHLDDFAQPWEESAFKLHARQSY